MNKAILITGITGSGKSAVCDELQRCGYKAFGFEDIEGLCAMVDKTTGKVADKHDNDDLENVKQHDWICDKDRLEQLINKNAGQTAYYCGVASNIDKLLPLFDKVILLQASPKVLRKRLSTRSSNDFGRTSEIQDWVFSWKGWWEDLMREKGAVVVDADQNLSDVVSDIIRKDSAPFLSSTPR